MTSYYFFSLSPQAFNLAKLVKAEEVRVRSRKGMMRSWDWTRWGTRVVCSDCLNRRYYFVQFPQDFHLIFFFLLFFHFEQPLFRSKPFPLLSQSLAHLLQLEVKNHLLKQHQVNLRSH